MDRRMRPLVRPDTVLRWHRDLIAREHDRLGGILHQYRHAP
ncbi:hypothetical protein [Streptomyces sp. NBC_01198]|nr:hypothetical protein OG702_05335 [Streptomyces sp. NBC_01198]